MSKALETTEYTSQPNQFYDDEEEPIGNDAAVVELARQFTNASHAHPITPTATNYDPEKHVVDHAQLTYSVSSNSDNHSSNPFVENSNPKLDPFSDEFNAREWSKFMLRYRENDPETYPLFAAGVSFKNLSAFGYTEGTGYQKTVANVLLELKNIFTGFKQTGPKTVILKEFNGLVRSGETCIVLGTPGA